MDCSVYSKAGGKDGGKSEMRKAKGDGWSRCGVWPSGFWLFVVPFYFAYPSLVSTSLLMSIRGEAKIMLPAEARSMTIW